LGGSLSVTESDQVIEADFSSEKIIGWNPCAVFFEKKEVWLIGSQSIRWIFVIEANITVAITKRDGDLQVSALTIGVPGLNSRLTGSPV